MAVKEILVHLKAHEPWSTHIDHGLGLGAFFGARVRGLMTFLDVAILRGVLAPNDPSVAERAERLRAEAQGTVERFHERAKALGVEAVFEFAEGAASEIVLWASRLHDLTVIEQRDPAGDELGYDPAEQAALSSGRPVLVTPRQGAFNAAPRHLVVAWNGSREAAAAVQAARPFIEKAQRVTVLTGSEKHVLRASARVPDLSIRGYLERHVAKVSEEKVKVSPDEAGAHLLARCDALEADMLVMGIYGRSWFSELILGGATRHVLQTMRLPVLMAH